MKMQKTYQGPGGYFKFKDDLFRLVISCLLGLFLTIWSSSLSAQQTDVAIDPEFAEQVNQLTDNFEAMHVSFVQGQEKITEIEEKIAKLRANEALMGDPRVRSALQKLEKAGLSNKLANSKTILAGFEKGAKNIASGAGDAIEKYENIKGYYDRWNPNSDSPTRPLELIGNSLEELQSIIYTLDPTPDNLLTKPLGEFIGFYKDSTQAFVGALNRTQTAINNRRQNCIGQGCGLGSISGSKDADFIALGTGDTIRLVRNIRPALGPVGELWSTGGGTIYMYQTSTSGMSGFEVVTRTTGQWFTMKCSLGQFNQIYQGMRLAYGEIAAVPTLISRCNQDFSAYAEASKRAEDYWDLLNPSRDDQFCTSKRFSRSGFPGEPKSILEKANNDRAQFIAMYTYKPNMRQSVDRLIPALSGSIFVEGKIDPAGDADVSGGNIAITLLGRSGSASMGADRRFEIDLPVKADAERRIGRLLFTAPDFSDYETDIAVDGACADLGTISVVLTPDNAVDYSQHENALREMRALVGQAEALRQQGLSAISNVENEMAILDAEIARLKTSVDGLAAANGPPEMGASGLAAVNQLKLLERQAFAIAQRMADIRGTIRQKRAVICDAFERIETAFDIQSVDAIYSEVPVAKNSVDSLMAEYRSLLVQLEQLKQQALNVHSGSGLAPASGAQNGGYDDLEAQIDQAGTQILRVEEQIAAVQAINSKLAGLTSQGQGILAMIASLDRPLYGAKGDDLLAAIRAHFGQIDAYRDELLASSRSLDGLTGTRKNGLSAIRQNLASVRQNSGTSATAGKDSSAQSKKDIALNSFNASHDTALIYTDAIESSANNARYCNDSALAMYNHRHDLDQLASRTQNPAKTEDETPAAVSQAEPTDNPELPTDVAETGPPPAPAGPPKEQAPTVVADNDPEASDPCRSKKVLGLFGKASRALDRENIGGWKKAAQKIVSSGCQNDRLEASIARADAIVDQKNRERESAERIAAVEDRMPEPATKSRGRGFGDFLGAIGTVLGAVNSGRGRSPGTGNVEGVLGSIFGGGNAERPATSQNIPQAPRSAPTGGAKGSYDRGSTSGGLGAMGNAGVVPKREGLGAVSGSGSGSRASSYACTVLQSKITGVADHINRAAAARNIDKLRELTKERDQLFDQVCRANCGYPLAAYCTKKIR